MSPSSALPHPSLLCFGGLAEGWPLTAPCKGAQVVRELMCRRKKKKTSLKIPCASVCFISCSVWVFYAFFFCCCFLARRIALHSCTQRKGIKLTRKKDDLLANVVFHFVHWKFKKTTKNPLTIPRLLASFMQSLYQIWILSLLNYGSLGFSATEASSVGK